MTPNRIISLGLFTLLLIPSSSAQNEPLSQADVLGLAASVSPDRVVQVVIHHGISFQPTIGYFELLSSASVNPAVIKSIQTAKVRKKTTSSTTNELALLSHLARCAKLNSSKLERPNDPKAHAAEHECRAAVALAPENPFVAMALAHSLSNLVANWVGPNRPTVNEVLAECKRAVAIDPSNSDAHAYLFDALTRTEHREEGIREGLDALVLDSNNSFAITGFLFLFGDSGVSASDITSLQNEVTLHPAEAGPHAVLGIAYNEKLEKAKAEGEFRQAVHLDSTCAICHWFYAGALRERGDVQGALAEIEAAKQLDSQNALYEREYQHLLSESKDRR